MSISIGSTSEWEKLLSSTSIVVADFYADWCGPCKMIAPHYEKLANEHSRPKKVAFAKINVDTQSTISRTQGVSAMPTFKIFHNGNCIETIKGANPPALTQAVSNALRLAGTGGGQRGESFKTPGRKLGGEGLSQNAPRNVARAYPGRSSWNIGGLLNAIVAFVGLYLVSLFSVSHR
ncbi:putative thioredoxin [Mariannaea sp. PMI_226]|nr:putative thioredoxin [Mariannaea sp. PMI_226]